MSVFITDGLTYEKPEKQIRKSRKKYFTKYSIKYQDEYPWAMPSSKGDLHSYCNLCDVHICIKSVGAKGLRDHEATCRHSQKAHQMGIKPALNTSIIPMISIPSSSTSLHHPQQRFVNNQTFIHGDESSLLNASNTNTAAPSTSGQRNHNISQHPVLQQPANDIVFSHDLSSFPTQQFNSHVPMPSARGHHIHNASNVVINTSSLTSAMYTTSLPNDSIDVLCSKTSAIIPNNDLGNTFQDQFNNIINPKISVGLMQEQKNPNPQVNSSLINTDQSDSSCYQQKKTIPTPYYQFDPMGISTTLPVVNKRKSQNSKFPSSLNSVAEGTSLGDDPQDEFSLTSDENFQEESNDVNANDQPISSKEDDISEEDLTCNICEQIFLDWKELKKHLLNHITNAQKMQAATSKTQVLSNKKKDERIQKKRKKESNSSIKEKRRRGRPAKTQDVVSQSCEPVNHLALELSSSKPSRKRGRPPKMSKNELSKNDSFLEADTFSVAEEEYWVETFELETPQEEINDPISQAPVVIPSEVQIAPSRRSGQLQCRVCRAMFYQKEDLQNHYKMDHNNGKPYECDICSKFFTTKNHLEVHQKHKHHAGPNPCQCIECGKVLSTRTNLRIHMKIHKGEKPFFCPICNKQFSRKANMEMHKVYHTGERRFTCEICGQSFFAINALKRHKKLHTGEREFACNMCKATYVTGTDLRRHKLKHEDVKPFPCTICDKQFTRSHDLKIHMRYHNKELRFRCTICGKEFVESGNFKRHMRRHTGERPYTCKICEQTFSQVHHYKVHMKVNHPEPELSTNIDLSRIPPDLGIRVCYSPSKNRSRNTKVVPNGSENDLNTGLNNPMASNHINPTMSSPHGVHINVPNVHGSHTGVPMMTPHHSQGSSTGFLQHNSYIYSNSGVIQQYPNIFDMCIQPQQPQQTIGNHVVTHQN